MQVPAPKSSRSANISVLPLLIIVDLSHQQVEINWLMQIEQQWSAEGLCQYNQGPIHYSQDRLSTNAGRCRSTVPAVLQTCHQSHKIECPDNLMSWNNRSIATTIGGFNTTTDKSQTKEGIPMLHQMPITIQPQ